jgi:hypothetical protein
MTLIVKPSFNGMTDADAIAYVNAVEAADGQLLEFGVGKAINDFVVGCKLDNTWSAIKASCILAGARTLAGALVPLVGAAPTNPFVNPANESLGRLFVSGDYNRKTGLVGDGSTKYLDSNRNNNADPQDSNHNASWISTVPTVGVSIMGVGDGGTNGANNLLTSTTAHSIRSRNSTQVVLSGTTQATNFFGFSRSSSASFNARSLGSTSSNTQTSQSPAAGNVFIYTRNLAGTPSLYSNARLAFYSIGESLDLALLDARVSALITAFGVAIP